MVRSRITNRYLKWPSRENYLELKKAKRFSKNLTKKAKKQYFKPVSSKYLAANLGYNQTLDSDFYILINDKEKIVNNLN